MRCACGCVLGVALSVWLSACGVLSRSETALIEPRGAIGEDREWAMRITVLELGDETGGFVEYYRLDGIYNTARSPYVAVDACSYFGPVPARSDSFRIVADGVSPGERLILQGRWRSARRREATVTVEQDGGLGPIGDGDGRIDLVLDEEQPADRRCRRAAAGAPPADAASDGSSSPDAVLDAATGT